MKKEGSGLRRTPAGLSYAGELLHCCGTKELLGW
jgi:hypothetical protein